MNVLTTKTKEMGSSSSNELGEIIIWPWGGPGGNNWVYKPNEGLVKQIIIVYGEVIDSIRFGSVDDQNGKLEYSPRFGGPGGDKTEKVNLDSPVEYLTNIIATTRSFAGSVYIKSLLFLTNITRYGPFGTPSNDSLSIPMEGGVIVGFNGRASHYLDAIGFSLKPISSICIPKVIKEIQELSIDSSSAEFQSRSAGPWGGFRGKEWDDGVNSLIKQVLVVREDSLNVIHAVRFEYEKTNGETLWSPRHGGHTGGVTVNRISVDYPKEFLIGIAGYYGPEEANGGLDTIRSITFYTNMARYGPYGDEIGSYFSSSGSKGKVVGFHGRSGAFLNAIGVHMEYN